MTIASELTTINNTKQAIKTAIEAKGVTVGTVAFADYATKIGSITGGGTNDGLWHPMPQWNDISSPAANTVSMVFADSVLDNAFTATTTGGVDYTVIVYGAIDDTTTTCTINGSSIAFGTPATIASGVQCDISFTDGSGKATDYGYTCFRVDVTSANMVLTCKMKKHSNDNVWSYNSLLWCVVNAGINDTANMFYDTTVISPALQTCSITSTALTMLGDNTFRNCNGLQSVSIPASVTSIATSCFHTCYSLQSVVIPDGVTTIGINCFYNCSSLQSVSIPASVTSIGTTSFYYCNSLRSIMLPSVLTTIGMNLFSACQTLQELTIPTSVTSIGASFANCYSLHSINNLENITASNSDFDVSSCYNLEAVNAPNITFQRIRAQCASGKVGKLHSLTFSASSTFTGTAPQIDISYTSFSDTELNALFTALPSMAKTIKITGCTGTATCDTSIATAKGWTVTTA